MRARPLKKKRKTQQKRATQEHEEGRRAPETPAERGWGRGGIFGERSRCPPPPPPPGPTLCWSPAKPPSRNCPPAAAALSPQPGTPRRTLWERARGQAGSPEDGYGTSSQRQTSWFSFGRLTQNAALNSTYLPRTKYRFGAPASPRAACLPQLQAAPAGTLAPGRTQLLPFGTLGGDPIYLVHGRSADSGF